MRSTAVTLILWNISLHYQVTCMSDRVINPSYTRWVCCVALPCCLFDLASFFLPSHLSLKHVQDVYMMYTGIHRNIQMSVPLKLACAELHVQYFMLTHRPTYQLNGKFTCMFSEHTMCKHYGHTH